MREPMTAGRELDALVAEKVMDWTPWVEQRGGYEHITWQKAGEREPWHRSRNFDAERQRYSPLVRYDAHHHIESGLPRFSRDIADAWNVVEKLQESGDAISLIWYGDAKVWGCLIHRLPVPEGDAATAPLAICLAALAAFGATERAGRRPTPEHEQP